MAKQQQRQPREKIYWKDGLRALQQNEAQRATRQRMWQRLFDQAKTDLQADEAVVFLGVENVDILRRAEPQPPVERPPFRLPLPALMGVTAAVVISMASYALSYYRIAARMR